MSGRRSISGRPANVADVLREAAERTPDKIAHTYLGETGVSSLNYGELDRRARAVAGRLRERGAAGDRVLLLFAPGSDFIAAFFGCLYAGVTAIPANLPWYRGGFDRLEHIIRIAGVYDLLTTSAVAERMRRRFSQSTAAALNWIETDALPDVSPPVAAQPSANPIAAIQFSSGSTALPRGVCLTHANVLSNAETIRQVAKQDSQSVIVSWLPHHHDMGLFGAIVQSIFIGGHCVLLSPSTFLRHPIQWLQAISAYRGTSSGAPNFAYDLCARRITRESCEGLDLNSWQTAFNGSEPVRASTMSRFSEAFASFGFNRRAFCPCYGLAESTLLVSAIDQGEAWTGARPSSSPIDGAGADILQAENSTADVISCGVPRGGHHVVIVDPETLTECGEGHVGEICVAGPSVADGYWNDEPNTSAVFGAQLADGRRPYLRSGDLGFMRGGAVFVAGRLRDVIIVRGQKYAPEDIEWAAGQSDPSLAGLSIAAFIVDGEDDGRLVVLCERPARTTNFADLVGAMRQAVNEATGLQLREVRFVERGRLPRTTSGKLQRHRCRQAFVDGHAWTQGEVVPAPAQT